jgi:hypothetical protein
MNKGWLWVGVVSAAAVVGAAIWVADAEEDAEDDLVELHAGDVPPHDRGPRDDARRGRARGRSGAATARIDALEEKVEALEREVALLRASAGLSARIAAGTDDEPVPTEDPIFEGAVREIIESDRSEEREAEMERRRERFAEMIDASATELAEHAGLDADRRNSIAALWQSEADRLLPLFMAGRSGDRPFSEIRDEVDKLRAETDAEAKKVLSPEQQQLYDELRPRGRRGGRDRDRDGGRGR